MGKAGEFGRSSCALKRTGEHIGHAKGCEASGQQRGLALAAVG
jgi:hypothetical protein